MRKLFSLLLLSFIYINVNAQSAHTVFISDAEILWLDKEITDLRTAYDEMSEALLTEDYKIIASKKRELVKSINRMSTNSNIMRQKIETEINPPAKRANADLDTPSDYYYNKKKKTEGLQELKLTDTNWSSFAENAHRIKAIKDNLSGNGYNLGPKYTETADNMSQIAEMLDLAETSHSIIQRSTVE